jgi:hypothetical protein
MCHCEERSSLAPPARAGVRRHLRLRAVQVSNLQFSVQFTYFTIPRAACSLQRMNNFPDSSSPVRVRLPRSAFARSGGPNSGLRSVSRIAPFRGGKGDEGGAERSNTCTGTTSPGTAPRHTCPGRKCRGVCPGIQCQGVQVCRKIVFEIRCKNRTPFPPTVRMGRELVYS